MRDRLTTASAALALILTTFFFAPLSVLLLNAGEIATSPFSVVSMSWALQLASITVVALLLILSSASVLRILACLFISVAGLVYLQGNFFVWDYGPLDGTDIDWKAHKAAGAVEIIFWLGLPVLAARYHRKLWPHIRALAVVIILLQLASLIAHLATGRTFPGDRPVVTKEIDRDFFSFSSTKNVLVIVTDTFATPMFDRILEEKPALAKRFSGFINYRNTLGVSPYTLLSIPTILSSRVYENAGTIQSFMSDAFGKNSLPSVLQDNGYKAGVVSMDSYKDYLKWLPGHDITSVLYDEGQDRQCRDNLQVWDVTLFRHSPHVIKQKLYDKHQWFLQGLFLDEVVGAGDAVSSSSALSMRLTPVQEASGIFLDRFGAYAALDSELPTFKFVHLFTSHPPFLIKEDGSPLLESEFEAIPVEDRAFAQYSYALTEILEVLETLRQLGIYDETMVIIAADHGTDITNKTRPVFKRRAQPLLLIKPFDRDGDLQSSQAPTSLLDIPATVSTALGIKGDFSGYAILDEEIPDSRARDYYYFDWGGKEFWNIDHLPFLDKYEVNGPVSEVESWSKACRLKPAAHQPAPC